MSDLEHKKVSMDLESVRNQNAFTIIGAFREAARKQGWSEVEIENLVFVAMGGNFQHLVSTVEGVCK